MRPDGIKKGYEWWLGAIINKIKISNPKIILINCIRTPPNSCYNSTIAIADSGANIHLANQATAIKAPVIMSN